MCKYVCHISAHRDCKEPKETEACLEIALDLNYFSDEEYEKLEENRCEIGFILNSFIKSLRNKV